MWIFLVACTQPKEGKEQAVIDSTCARVGTGAEWTKIFKNKVEEEKRKA